MSHVGYHGILLDGLLSRSLYGTRIYTFCAATLHLPHQLDRRLFIEYRKYIRSRVFCRWTIMAENTASFSILPYATYASVAHFCQRR